MPPLKDLTGVIFGNLTVISRTSNRNQKACWLCKCSCGSFKKIRGSDLICGKVVSCGCKHKQIVSVRRKKASEVCKGKIFYDYKKSAQKANIPYELPYERFSKLIEASCHYCGSFPYRMSHYMKNIYAYHGIDKLIPSKGYVEDNMVTCCTPCNFMKGPSTEKDFIIQVNRIWEHFTEGPIDPHIEEVRPVKDSRAIYGLYKRNAKKRSIPFDLEFKLFEQLIASSCFYCGSPPSNSFKRKRENNIVIKYGGVDRLFSSVGYTEANVVPCCWKCNRMKRQESFVEFMKHVKTIQAYHPISKDFL